jgi:peptidoglycan/xylan/chitin deacetylase (PgdA/CDA1 family)
VDPTERQRRRADKRARTRRRRIIGLVAACGVAVVVTAGVLMARSGSPATPPAPTPSYEAATPPRTATAAPATTVGRTSTTPARDEIASASASAQRITPARPGAATVITEGPRSAGRTVALTIDDGTCPSCVARIVSVLERTGGKATLFPNGMYARSWEPQAARIRALVQKGQVTLGNHTYSHGVSTQIGATAFAADLQRNEEWIQRTFRLTGRPWFRPPYGDHNASIDAAAGAKGYRRVIMWSGTVADSQPRSEGYILDAIDYWARPGAIILMHANYPATARALPRILTKLEKKGLEPVTLAEMLGPNT